MEAAKTAREAAIANMESVNRQLDYAQ
jgi:hypothetical protein